MSDKTEPIWKAVGSVIGKAIALSLFLWVRHKWGFEVAVIALLVFLHAGIVAIRDKIK